MGVGPIPIGIIWRWEDRTGITDPVLQRHLEAILMSVDALVCKRHRDQAEANRPTPKKRRR